MSRMNERRDAPCPLALREPVTAALDSVPFIAIGTCSPNGTRIVALADGIVLRTVGFSRVKRLRP